MIVVREGRPSRRDPPSLRFLHQWKSHESSFRLQDEVRWYPWQQISWSPVLWYEELFS